MYLWHFWWIKLSHIRAWWWINKCVIIHSNAETFPLIVLGHVSIFTSHNNLRLNFSTLWTTQTTFYSLPSFKGSGRSLRDGYVKVLNLTISNVCVLHDWTHQSLLGLCCQDQLFCLIVCVVHQANENFKVIIFKIFVPDDLATPMVTAVTTSVV